MNLKRNQVFFVLLILISASFILFYPVFLGKIPFNGNFLVSFYSPWSFQKFEGYATGVPSKAVSWDQIRQYYPLFEHTRRMWRSGEIPLWNPYNFSGTPQLANLESASFYPLNIGFAFGRTIDSWIIFKISAVVLSGFFTFLYLQSLKLKFLPSLFGSLCFAFSSTMIIWGEEIWQSAHSVIWLPLWLFSIEKLIVSPKKIFWLVGIFSALFSILAGYFQTTLYVFIFTFTYFLFRTSFFSGPKVFLTWFKKNKHLFFLIGSIFPLSLLLGAIQLLPSIELYLLSPRKIVDLTQLNIGFLLPLKQFVTFFAPDFFGHIVTKNWIGGEGQYYEKMIYIGVVPIIFASLVWIISNRLKSFVNFFTIWFILSVLLIFQNPVAKSIYQFEIPLISTANPIRIIFILAFCISILSAMGFSVWSNSPFSKIKWKLLISLLPFIIIYLLLILFLFFARKGTWSFQHFPPNWTLTALRNLAVPLLVFFLAALLQLFGSFFKKLRLLSVFLILCLLFSHALFFLWKYLPFSEIRFLYPSAPILTFIQKNAGIDRFWTLKGGILENNFATVYKIFSLEGYDPLNILRYNELLSSTYETEKTVFSRSDASISRDLGSSNEALDKRWSLLNLMGVHYIINSDDSVLSSQTFHTPPFLEKIWEDKNFTIYNNRNALPRAFLADNYIVESKKEMILKRLYDPQLNLKNTLILEEDIANFEPKYSDENTVQIINYSPQKVEIKTSSHTNQFLFLSDTYYPGWEAKIDGIKTKIHRADYAFRAVPVQAGNHLVSFEYKPLSLKLGLTISALTLFSIILLIWFKNISQKLKPSFLKKRTPH